ncbi:MAG TPA: ACT domain-containing protein [Mycobacteriales bacterium]|nr:ACT domain-containing protein [Mycobacteriales bacterium]
MTDLLTSTTDDLDLDLAFGFARLRIELPDHPGALAAISRVLAARRLNVVELAIHEVDGERAVDEIVVHGPVPDHSELAPALAGAGADLLSIARCEMRGDPVVSALTWVTATLKAPSRRSALATGLRTLTGLDNLYVAAVEEAVLWPIGAAAVRAGRLVLQRLAQSPEPLRTVSDGTGSGVWVLAAPDSGDPSLVVLAARPYSMRFTATELNRLSAVLDCRRGLVDARTHPADTTLMRWSRGLAGNA